MEEVKEVKDDNNGKVETEELNPVDDETLKTADALSKAMEGIVEDEDSRSENSGGDPDDDSGQKTEETPEGEPKAAEEDEPQELPEELVEKAIRLGLSMKAVKGFADAEHLESVVATIEAKQPKEQSEESEEKPSEEVDLLEGLDPEAVDDGTFKVLKNMSERLSEQSKEIKTILEENKMLKQQLEGASQFIHHQKSLDLSRRYDPVFSGLGIDDKLGEDTASATDEQMKLRMEILTEAGMLAESYKRVGRKVPAREELVRRAAEVVVGEVKSPGKRTVPHIGIPSGKRKPETKQAELEATAKQLSAALKHL